MPTYQTINDAPKELLDFLQDKGCSHLAIVDGKLCGIERDMSMHFGVTFTISIGLSFIGREMRYFFVTLDDALNSYECYTRLIATPENYFMDLGPSGNYWTSVFNNRPESKCGRRKLLDELLNCGQSLHYPLLTNKKPGIALILRNPSDKRYREQLEAVIEANGLDIKVWVIGEQ